MPQKGVFDNLILVLRVMSQPYFQTASESMWVQTAESADLQIRTLDVQSNVLLGFWIPA